MQVRTGFIVALMFALGVLLTFISIGNDELLGKQTLGGLLLNLGTGLIGSAVTYLLLERSIVNRARVESEIDRYLRDLRGGTSDRQARALLELSSIRGLSGLDLSGARLAGIDFTGRDLTGTNFQSADLHGAVFESAKLVDCNFRSADLRAAVLNSADLTRASFADARMETCFINGAILVAADLTNANLAGVDTSKADMSGAKGLS